MPNKLAVKRKPGPQSRQTNPSCGPPSHHISKLIAPAINDVRSQRSLNASRSCAISDSKERHIVQRQLVNHHGHALGLYSLHDALHGERAEVVRPALHGEVVHTHYRRRNPRVQYRAMDGAVPNRDTEGANRRDYSMKDSRA